MGEKIKDITDIKIGNSNFLVELNHGYSTRNKYSIHIQNSAFRFAMNDKEFLKLCGLLMKGESELEYLKGTTNND